MPVKLRIGDMFQEFDVTRSGPTDENVKLVTTTNGVLGAHGLVMGKGHAKIVRDKASGIACRFSSRIAGLGTCGENPGRAIGMVWTYHLVRDPVTGIYALQTKWHWRDPSRRSLVTKSLIRLADEIRANERNFTWHIPLPGAGLGGLSNKVAEASVREILGPIDRDINMWRLR